MARRAPEPRPREDAPPSPPRPGDRLRTAALLLLTSSIAARPLMRESLSLERFDILTGAPLVHAGPLLSALVWALILTAAALWALAEIRHPRGWRITGLEPGAAIVAVAAWVSCATAADVRAAVNEAAQITALLTGTVLLAQLLRAAWQQRLVLAALGASGVVFAFEAAQQWLFEYEQTIALYYEQVAAQSAAPAAKDPLAGPARALAEARLAAREASGFFAHSGLAGEALLLMGLAIIALAVARWRSAEQPPERAFAVFTGVVGLSVLAALPLTGSRASVAALGVAALLALAGRSLAHRIRAHPGRFLLAGLMATLVLTAGVVVYGVVRGGLPGASLQFRWRYWSNALCMIADHPWTGVGGGNFGYYYPRYMAPQDLEEVRDPHNPVVRAAAEWGILGGVGGVLLLVGAATALALPAGAPLDLSTSANPPPGRPLRWAAALVPVILVLRLAALDYLPGEPLAPAIVVMALTPVGIWALAFVALTLDTNRLDRFADRPLRGLTPGIGIALVAFLLADSISFGLWHGGVGTVAGAVFAVALVAKRGGWRVGPSRVGAVAALVCVGAGAGVWASLIVWPVGRAWWHIEQARLLAARGAPAERVLEAYAAATHADPWDAIAPREAADWLIERQPPDAPSARAILARAEQFAQIALQRNGEHFGHWWLAARIAVARGQLEASPRYCRLGVELAREALKRYPNNPWNHARLGELLLAAARCCETRDLTRQALSAFRRALELNARRPPNETFRRFGPEAIEHIRARINETQALLDSGQ